MATKNNEPLFDTYMAVKEISDHGISEDAAAAIIKYTVWAQQIHFSHLASKEDVEITKMTLQKETEEIRSEIKRLDGEIKRLDGDIKRLDGDIKRLDGDIKHLELSTQQEIKRLEFSMQKEIAVSARKTVIWISGILLANTGLMVSLMKLL